MPSNPQSSWCGSCISSLIIALILYNILIKEIVHNSADVGFFVTQASIHCLNSTELMENLQFFGRVIAIVIQAVSGGDALLNSVAQEPECRNGAFALIHGLHLSAAGFILFENNRAVSIDGGNQPSTDFHHGNIKELSLVYKFQNRIGCLHIRFYLRFRLLFIIINYTTKIAFFQCFSMNKSKEKETLQPQR